MSRGGTGAGSFTAGSLLFSNGTSITQDNSNLFWDDSNNRLGIGTSSPTSKLDVSGDATINSLTVGLGGGSLQGNTVFGKNARINNINGARNVAVGERALFATQTNDNTAVGQSSLGGNSNSGEQNTAVGLQTLQANTTGSYNAAYGYQALQFNTTGNSNVAIGKGALINNTTGGSNVALGQNAVASQAADNNSIVIGTDTTGAGSNKAVIGNSNMTDIYFGSSAGLANTHAKKMFLGSSTTPGCIIMGDTASGVGYVTLDSGVLTVSSTPPSACQ